MKRKKHCKKNCVEFRFILALVLFLFVSGLKRVSAQENRESPSVSSENRTSRDAFREKWNSGWSLFVDNDLMVGQDQEYTGGIALNLSGRRAAEWPFSLDPVLGFINRVTGVRDLGAGKSSFTSHSMEFGFTAFTPEDTDSAKPIRNDHPYAGLVFLNNVRQKTLPEEGITYRSVLTLGVLGTSVPEEAQEITHEITGSDGVEGWDHQISDGGEPTARYTLLRQDVLVSNRQETFGDVDLKGSFGGSAGYLTEVQGGFNVRWGRITTPAWSFHPNFSGYMNLETPNHRGVQGSSFPSELYFWAGVHGKLRGYNAFLEGQFRDSTVTFDRSELNPWIGVAGAGITCGFQTGTQVSVAVRGQTAELDEATGNRPLWGTFLISQAY